MAIIHLILALLQDPSVPTMATTTDRACPFVVVTISAGPIDSFDKPHNIGKMATFRTCPDGKSATYPAKDVDWAATERANTPRVVVAPTPDASRSQLSSMAADMKTQNVESLEARQKDWGQLRTKSGKTYAITSDSYFKEISVAKHLTASQLVANFGECPDGQALIYGSVRNASRLKLSGLRGAVQILAVYRDIDLTQKMEILAEQIQSFDPAELMPGDSAELRVRMPCKSIWRGYLNKNNRYQDPQYFLSQGVQMALRDVGGKAEPLASPATAPYAVETPAAHPAPTPAPRRSP